MSYTIQRNLNRQPLFTNGTPLLQHLDIELTERCNNACRHCYINLPQSDRHALVRELSTVEWQDILRQAADLGALSVRITGGEPLLRQDFAELYLFIRRLGMKVKLYTNARLVTPELAELFAHIPPREKIEITVYGMHPETYDAAACAPGGYAEFQRGVALLLAYKVPFIVKGAFLPYNVDECQEFEVWAKTIPWMNKPPSYVVFLYQRGRHDKPTWMQRIHRARITPEMGVAFLSRQPGYLSGTSEFCQRFSHPMGERLFQCGAGHEGCVDAYGNYQPCMMLRDPALTTDLRTSSLKEALDASLPRLQGLSAIHPDFLSRCARCFLRGLCESCPAASYAEHGRLDQPVDYFCQVAHLQARSIGLLAEGENAWEVLDWKERLENLQKDSL